MIDNGYLFTKDNKRIFINTSLGCAGECSYCYLPKIGYSNSSENYGTISAQNIIEFIEKNELDVNQKTLITLGCYSECWDKYNKNETISLIKYFLKRGNKPPRCRAYGVLVYPNQKRLSVLYIIGFRSSF